MALQIYNTMTRQKEPFTPEPGARPITIYNCGPTVYDRFHIGNARNFVVMDVVRRYLQWLGYEVKFVQNLTDIDDKIIARAAERGDSADAVAREFTAAYFEDAEKLGVAPADAHPKATEYVPQMIEFMRKLEAAGFAYARGGSLYFRVRKAPGYGRLSGRNLDDLLEGARVEVNEEKEDPLDFVLWKAAKPGEPKWPSPWGEGRPGWHTECAVMTLAELGETIDIHSGGSDLKFPHHENELAQRECLSSHPFVRFWMHNGFLNIDSEKMSKSVGNIRRMDDVFKIVEPEAVRYFLLSAHYRQSLDYNRGALEEAANTVRRIDNGLRSAEKVLRESGILMVGFERLDRTNEIQKRHLQDFEEAMNDDFNTPRAFAVLHILVARIHELLAYPTGSGTEELKQSVVVARTIQKFFQFESGLDEQERLSREASLEPIDTFIRPDGNFTQLWKIPRFFEDLAVVFAKAEEEGRQDILADIINELSRYGTVDRMTPIPKNPAGLLLSFGSIEQQLALTPSSLIELMVSLRRICKERRYFSLADLIRDRLKARGYVLEDRPGTTIWRFDEVASAH